MDFSNFYWISIRFSTYRGTLYRLSLLFTYIFSQFFFFQIWLQERFQLLQPPTITPRTYHPRHFRDCWLHQNDMSFEAYMELIGCIKETDIQWVVEWWHISSMVHHCYKDYYVPLVGLRCYSYYSTCCISRQFRERLGAFNGEGAFHTEVFTNRILGRLCEAWPRHRVTRGIAPP